MTRMSVIPFQPLHDRRRTIVVLLAAMCMSSLSGCVALRRDTGSEDVITARQMSLRGFDSLRRGKLEDAEAWFANSIETNPVDDEAHEQYAELLWQRNLRSDAIQHLEKAVKLSGGNGRLVVRLGEMYLAEGDAKRVLKKLQSLDDEASVLIVSHQPLVGELVSVLCEGNVYAAHPYVPSEIVVIECEVAEPGMGAIVGNFQPLRG